jgi:hypothetical protein
MNKKLRLNHLNALGISIGTALIISTTLYTQSVSEAEVKSSKKVVFQNKNYKKAAPAVRDFHESIGKKLAKFLMEKSDESHFFDGVTLTRINPTQDSLGADVLYLDDSTDIGHINTVQRIISGYIQEAYQYKEEDAFFLARYILYYNAINRGKMDYVKKKYSRELANIIKPKDLGISKSYKDWPGHTQILLPLEGNPLKKSKADLTLGELDERVNEVGEKRASSEDKKKLTEIIQEKAETEKKLIKEKKDEISKDLESLEKKKKNLEVKLNDIGSGEAGKVEVTKLKKEKEEIEGKIANLKEQKSELDTKDPGTKTDVGKVSPASAESQSKEKDEKADQKQDTGKLEPPKEPSPEVVKLEKELEKVKEELAAKVEEKSKNEFSANVVDGKIPIIKIFPDGTCANELHLLDPNKDDFVYKGNYTQICGKTFKDFGSGILVIGLKDTKENVRLVLLDKNELKPSTFSDVTIHPKSPLEVLDNFIYAIEFENGKYFLSRFDSTLKRMTKSDQEILPDSTITIFGKKVYVNARVEGGLVEIRIFNKDDLKFLKKTQT